MQAKDENTQNILKVYNKYYAIYMTEMVIMVIGVGDWQIEESIKKSSFEPNFGGWRC